MARPDSTRWSLILRAAEGERAAREEFSRHYEPIVRAYLGARWRGSPLRGEIQDAAQEVFLACLRARGALSRADPERPGGFRAYLFGVIKNVARRFEERWNRTPRQPDRRLDLEQIEGRDKPLSRIYDLAWAKSIVRQAMRLFAKRVDAAGDGEVRRVELLRLQFREDMPIREIARLWDADPARLHHEYARARRDFTAALREVVREHLPGEPERVETECERLAGYLA